MEWTSTGPVPARQTWWRAPAAMKQPSPGPSSRLSPSTETVTRPSRTSTVSSSACQCQGTVFTVSPS